MRLCDLEMQLSELDMLRSMFPEEGELKVEDPGVEADMRQWLERHQDENQEEEMETQLVLSLRLNVSHIEVAVTMGETYPSRHDQFRIYVRSDGFSREAHTRINSDLKKELEKAEEGELLAGVAVQWLQEHGQDYVSSKATEIGTKKEESDKSERFSRLWIYSHHIYSKTKRKNILSLASDFELTGFCMPGKPGIICLEGVSRNCAEVWLAIRGWNWKKINVKIQEDSETTSSTLDQSRRFDTFREIGFVKSGESRDYHMDMGEFYSYLKEHNSDYMFREFFGLDKDS